MASQAQAVRRIADMTGWFPVTVRFAARRLGEEQMIPRGSRGRTAHQVDAREVALLIIAVMVLSAPNSRATQAPEVVQQVMDLDAGPNPTICLMDDDGNQTPTAIGSFVTALAMAIEGREDQLLGSLGGLGLQFCRGRVRAWAEWQRIGQRVYFGVRQLPPGMVQEARIDAKFIDELRKLVTQKQSAATDCQNATTPAQVQTGPALALPESSSGCNRAPPQHCLVSMLKDSRIKEENQSPPDSGTDSPSVNTTEGVEPSWPPSRQRTPCAA